MHTGGYITTPEDLVKFGNAHLQAGLLKAGTLKELFTPQKTADRKSTGYGMNWFITADQGGDPVWYHPGASVGGNSIVLIYPRQRIVIAMQTNLSDSLTYSEITELPQKIARMFMK